MIKQRYMQLVSGRLRLWRVTWCPRAEGSPGCGDEFRGADEGLAEPASTWVAPREPFIYWNRVLDLPSVIKLMRRSTHTKPLGAG